MADVTVGSLVSITGASATTLQSPTIDASSGTDQLLVVGTVNSSTSEVNATGVTWDVPSPENFDARVNISELANFGSDLWSLDGFTQATDTATATWASSPDDMCLFVREYENVNQTTPIGNTGTDFAANGSVSISLTGVASGDMCVDCYGNDESGSSGSQDVGADQTERVEITSSGSYPMSLAMSEQDGSDGGVMSYSASNSDDSVYTAMVIKQTAAGGGLVPQPRNMDGGMNQIQGGMQ